MGQKLWRIRRVSQKAVHRKHAGTVPLPHRGRAASAIRAGNALVMTSSANAAQPRRSGPRRSRFHRGPRNATKLRICIERSQAYEPDHWRRRLLRPPSGHAATLPGWLKIRCHTSFLRPRSACRLHHLPNSSGRSRHGVPVRATHNTTSRTRAPFEPPQSAAMVSSRACGQRGVPRARASTGSTVRELGGVAGDPDADEAGIGVI